MGREKKFRKQMQEAVSQKAMPQKPEYSIASALEPFNAEDEARLCAYISTFEKARRSERVHDGADVMGWGLWIDDRGAKLAVNLESGETIEASGVTVSEAIQALSKKFIEAGMQGAASA